MRAHPLVKALEPHWRDRLDAVARSRGWPASTQPEKLADAVAALSEHYNRHQRAPERLDAAAQGARLGFFFPRDVAKGAGGVRELVEHGALVIPEGRPFKILDLGAGLGATTIGAVRAMRAAGITTFVDALAVDQEPTGLEIAPRLAQGVTGLALTARATDLRGVAGKFDLILLGQVLLELDSDREDRDVVHADLVRTLLDRHLEERGSLVIVEPALREPTRHLHRVRDRLVAGGAGVFAPCLHAGACPMLKREADWCHEHVAVDLPSWLVPVAQRAGLRWEGLTFSYLALRRDGLRRPGALRVVSEPLPSKGRADLWVCGELPEGPDRLRVGRIDRHASETNADFSELARGDVVAIEPLSARIGVDTRVTRQP